jgi:3-hydroxy-9,10-secoandrosta-1,3,5(10)-triene-9,17-dione monooxygenase reductase component
MPFDSKTYRQTVGRFPTGVTVIAFEAETGVQAMTANSFTSLSLDPPLLLFCPAKTTKTGQLIHRAAGFSVNILREDQQSLSTFFAGGWKEAVQPPYRFVPLDGVPRLEGSLASLACSIEQILEGGDHWIVIGKVISLHQGIEPLRPLAFHLGRYTNLQANTSSPAPDLSEGFEPVPVHYHYESY